MPADRLEELARAAVEAWDKWLGADTENGPELKAMNESLYRIDLHFRQPVEPPPTRALDYMMPVRLQVELRLACALLASGYFGINEIGCGDVIDKARHLARLLLDAPA